MQTKIEYLSILFDAPPSGQQLSEQFGKDGWRLSALIPVFLHPEEGKEPVQKIQAYLYREASAIMVPTR